MTDERFDNRESREAAEVKEKSEYLKRVTDFAEFVQKEYVDESDGKALVIMAIDRVGVDGKDATSCIMVGDKNMCVVGLSRMMQQDGMRQVMQLARMLADDYGDLDERLLIVRRKRMVLWWVTALSFVWGGIVVAFKAMGVSDWLSMALDSLLMCVIGYWLWQAWHEVRREAAILNKDKADRTSNRIARLFVKSLARLYQKHDDNDE